MARLAAAQPARRLPPEPSAPGEAALPGAPLDGGEFRVARSIAAAAPGLAAVRLDAAVLAESPGLPDVRISAPDGRQIPYLPEARPEPLPFPLAPSAPLTGTLASRPGATVRALPLALGRPPPRASSSRPLPGSSRAPSGCTSTVATMRARARPIAEGTWAHADPGRPAPAFAVALPAVRGDRLLVALDDGDNAQLPLASAKLLLPAWRLRFFHPGPELRLLHGADGLASPRYDLALLAPRLRAAPAHEVALGAAPPPPPRRPSARTAFWIVLGGAVVGLLALVARLVRADASPAP